MGPERHEGILNYWTNSLKAHERLVSTLKESEGCYRELLDNMSSAIAAYEAIDNGTDFIFTDIINVGARLEGRREDVAEAYEYHANSYLVKPLNFNKFAALMDNLGFYWLAWNCKPPD